jgi:hypothetical protein
MISGFARKVKEDAVTWSAMICVFTSPVLFDDEARGRRGLVARKARAGRSEAGGEGNRSA